MLVAGCESRGPSLPVPNESIADIALTQKAMTSLATAEGGSGSIVSRLIGKFQTTAVTAKRMAQEPDSNGKWVERWDTKRGGTSATYSLVFMPAADGTVSVSVGDGAGAINPSSVGGAPSPDANSVLQTLQNWQPSSPQLSRSESLEDRPDIERYVASAWVPVPRELAIAYAGEITQCPGARGWSESVKSMRSTDRLEGAVLAGKKGICLWACIRLGKANGEFIGGSLKGGARISGAGPTTALVAPVSTPFPVESQKELTKQVVQIISDELAKSKPGMPADKRAQMAAGIAQQLIQQLPALTPEVVEKLRRNPMQFK